MEARTGQEINGKYRLGEKRAHGDWGPLHEIANTTQNRDAPMTVGDPFNLSPEVPTSMVGNWMELVDGHMVDRLGGAGPVLQRLNRFKQIEHRNLVGCIEAQQWTGGG